MQCPYCSSVVVLHWCSGIQIMFTLPKKIANFNDLILVNPEAFQGSQNIVLSKCVNIAPSLLQLCDLLCVFPMWPLETTVF